MLKVKEVQCEALLGLRYFRFKSHESLLCGIPVI
jgi:hypothetical protein